MSFLSVCLQILRKKTGAVMLLKALYFLNRSEALLVVKYIASCILASVGVSSAQPPNRHGVGAVTGSVLMTVQERLCLGMLFPGSRQV